VVGMDKREGDSDDATAAARGTGASDAVVAAVVPLAA